VTEGWLSDYLGQANPEKRAAREAETGLVSLLTLGFVRELVFSAGDTGWRKERTYQITASGRTALEEVLRA
jgi:hypothetical protein